MASKLTSKYIIIVSILFLVISASFLRFYNLGYSDYIGDEHKAFLQLKTEKNNWEFFMTRRKGPMQFLVAYIPYFFTHDYRNELAERIPFSIASIASVIVFYLFLLKVTKKKLVSFIASFLLLTNGFIVGFGRITQYQNLNLLFSFLALYFYADLKFSKTHLYLSSFLGTLFFSLSLLSHWDAVFYMPIILYFVISFITRKEFSGNLKLRIILFNFLTGCLLLLPFLIPYLLYFKGNEGNQVYLDRRIAFGYTNINIIKGWIDLYNPFITFWYLLVTSLIGIGSYKKSWPFSVWYITVLIFFLLFFTKPGTHIYNFLIPVFILSAFSIELIVRFLKKYFKIIPVIICSLFLVFFYYQAIVVFIDHKREYPWEQKKILEWTTPKYGAFLYDQRLPLFGFPHYRYWDLINNYINEQNTLNNEKFNYMTNEDKTVSEWYVEAEYKAEKFYFVAIKRPMSWEENWSGLNVGKKTLLKTLGEKDKTVVRIYKSKVI